MVCPNSFYCDGVNIFCNHYENASQFVRRAQLIDNNYSLFLCDPERKLICKNLLRLSENSAYVPAAAPAPEKFAVVECKACEANFTCDGSRKMFCEGEKGYDYDYLFGTTPPTTEYPVPPTEKQFKCDGKQWVCSTWPVTTPSNAILFLKADPASA